MTEASPPAELLIDPAAAGPHQRLVFALRQAAAMAFALLVMGVVTERLRPAEAIDRGFLVTPFLWAAVLWVALLVVNAVGFERTQMPRLEREPMLVAVAIGLIVLAIGLISFDAGSIGRRVVYLAANAVGVVLFWWAAIGLGYLVWGLTRPDPESRPH